MFRAHDPERDHPVAVKLFTLDLPPERVHQLVGEFEWLIAATLDHPALNAPIATGMVDASAYLVQDYVEAQSFDLAVREFGPAPAAHAVRVAAQLAGALDFAAAVNVTHGALHPRDVLLSAADMRITGIGVSRALEAVGVTPPLRRPYTAPERLEQGNWDRRADVFSLAALMHELLWAQRIGLAGSDVTTTIGPTAGCDLAALRAAFARALAVDPAARFSTALEFADALSQAFPDLAGQETEIALAGQDTQIAGTSPKIVDVSSAEAGNRAPPRAGPSAPRLPLDGDERAGAVATDMGATAVNRPAVAAPALNAAGALATAASATDFHAAGADTADIDAFDTDAFDTDAFDTDATDIDATDIDATIVKGAPAASLQVHPPDDDEQTLVGVPPDFSRQRTKSETPVLPAGVEAMDLQLKTAEDHQDVKAAPSIVEAPSTEDRQPPAPGSSERVTPVADDAGPRRSIFRPVAAALALGVGLGFYGGYSVGSRGQSKDVTAAPTTSGREFTENAVTASRPPQTASAPRPPAAANGTQPASGRQSAPTGRVLIRSTPAGALVVVDGREAGLTPIAVRDLANGTHEIRVTREGYIAVERRVVITAARPAQSLTVPLDRDRTGAADSPAQTPAEGSQRFVGTLVVDSRPSGARVYIDGKLAGNTPLSMRDIRAGEHVVRLEHDGYRRWSSSVRIVAAERNRLTASLER